jgi:hypothetical protein
MPNAIRSFVYNIEIQPVRSLSLNNYPLHMQKPLMQRYFNLSEDEWNNFCREMYYALPSEKIFHVLIAPFGKYSNIIEKIQTVLNCMQTLDWIADTDEGLRKENIVVVPSFSMFQAAINAKAYTLNRTPVTLVPTYGYIEADHYKELKKANKIAFSLYMPEADPQLRYSCESTRYVSYIDGHRDEYPWAGIIHDIYHAMREMAMNENVAKARWRLASIAEGHPNNKYLAKSRPVDDILVDGELIFSYAKSDDTMFNSDLRASEAQKFGDIFYFSSMRNTLHPNLKRAFIEDMVVNEKYWQAEFQIGKADLLIDDQELYDEIQAEQLAIEKKKEATSEAKREASVPHSTCPSSPYSVANSMLKLGWPVSKASRIINGVIDSPVVSVTQLDRLSQRKI